MAATQQPGQALASHLISQTVSSVALMETLGLISTDDAAAIRSRLPSPYTPFPALAVSSPQPPATPTTNYAVPGYGNSGFGASTASNNFGANPSPTSPAGARIVPSLPPRHVPDTTQRAKALWDYSGSEADDLQFRQGDIIIIDEEVNEQWYRGRVQPPHGAPNEKGGLFPSNYVEKIASDVRNLPPPGNPYQNNAPQYGHQQYAGPGAMVPQQQQPTTVVVAEEKHKKFGKVGSQLGNAAVTGAGFGFGSAVASNIVNAIL